MRYRVVAPLVLARTPKGLITHRYQGEVIDWLCDEQAESWLQMGLVELLDVVAEHQVPDTPDVVPDVPRQPGTDSYPYRPTLGAVSGADDADSPQQLAPDSHRVLECALTLDELGVSALAGAPAARRALRTGGRRFGNDVIAAAVRLRRAGVQGATA